MKPVFADTSFYIALLRPDDENHQHAIEFDQHFTGQFVTSEFVLIELGNWLADPRNRGVFLELCRVLRADLRTTIFPANSEWLVRGLALYGSRLDKHWSFIDCISFEIMRESHLTDALTTDHHFSQAGYHAILANTGK